MKKQVKTYTIDLFCGGGGTSTAIEESDTGIEVIWCINHDQTAIRSHKENNPNCIHSTEDIRSFDISELLELVQKLRREDPTCKIAVWASLECIEFSIGKNKGPKDIGSRTLAWDVLRYIRVLEPDMFWVENVKQFKNWYPLDEDGYEIKSRKGEEYEKWLKVVLSIFDNKHYDQNLTSADYGGVTIRNRLFLQFALDPNNIGIPIQTHSEKGDDGLLPWRGVKEVLNFSNVGKSIFNRKKDLVVNTHRKIFKSLVKFGPQEGMNYGIKYYGTGGFQDANKPSATLRKKDAIYMLHLCLRQNYGKGGESSLDSPCRTLTKSPKGELMSVLFNPQYGGSQRSVSKPCATLIARQDKAPMQVLSCLTGGEVIVHKDTDDEYMTKIKNFCIENGITDVFMRPLSVSEMLKVQGFPDRYVLHGTQTEQKIQIGNSVEVKVGIALFKAIDKQIQKAA